MMTGMPGPVRRCLTVVLALVAAGVVGCAPSVPDVPDAARSQVPLHAPIAPWFGQGRLEISYPAHRMSCTALVRHLADGHMRLVLLSDEGLELLDLTASASGESVTMMLPEMKRAVAPLARLIREAYGVPPEGAATWDDGHLVVVSGDDTRLYGGDPILLRAVSGPGLNLMLANYRFLGPDLMPLEVIGSAPFITITLSFAPDAVHVAHAAVTLQAK